MITLKLIDSTNDIQLIKAEILKIVTAQAQKWLIEMFFYHTMHKQIPQFETWREEAQTKIPGLEVEVGRLSAEVDKKLAAFNEDKLASKERAWKDAASNYGVARAELDRLLRRIERLNALIKTTNELSKPEVLL